MPSVTREIHIEAPPHVVRRHVTDAERRGSWLDEDADRPVRQAGRVLTFPTRHGGVSIELVPEGGGTRVRVTEQVDLPGTDAVEPDTAPAGADEVDTGDTPVALAA